MNTLASELRALPDSGDLPIHASARSIARFFRRLRLALLLREWTPRGAGTELFVVGLSLLVVPAYIFFGAEEKAAGNYFLTALVLTMGLNGLHLCITRENAPSRDSE